MSYAGLTDIIIKCHLIRTDSRVSLCGVEYSANCIYLKNYLRRNKKELSRSYLNQYCQKCVSKILDLDYLELL